MISNSDGSRAKGRKIQKKEIGVGADLMAEKEQEVS